MKNKKKLHFFAGIVSNKLARIFIRANLLLYIKDLAPYSCEVISASSSVMAC